MKRLSFILSLFLACPCFGSVAALDLQVPTIMPKPASGSTDYKCLLYIRDETGALVSAGGATSVSVTNSAGTSRDANASSVSGSSGSYSFTYTVASDHANEEIVIRFSTTAGGGAREATKISVVGSLASTVDVSNITTVLNNILKLLQSR